VKDEGDLIMGTDPKGRWVHKYQGYKVNIVELAMPRFKDANDAVWQDAVAYHREDTAGDSMTFIRSEKDFLAKFKPEKE
jgi:hypothetical protein